MAIENLLEDLDEQLPKVMADRPETPPPRVTQVVEEAEPTIEPYTSRRPSEILTMEFDPNDNLLGDHLLAKGSSLVMLGQGGLGKSSLLLKLAVCFIIGEEFLGFVTRGKGLKWLILQAENDNRRLKSDLERLKKWAGEKWDLVDEKLIIHTLEQEQDFFHCLGDISNSERTRAIIDKTQPDVVAFDPLKDFGIGDPNKDIDMAETCRRITALVKQGNPNRATVISHHALTGNSGAAKATGFDRASFGRNSKVLHSWARAVINITPASEDYSKLVIACGKNNNGKEFAPFGIERDPSTLIFRIDSTFDLAAWEIDVAGKKTRQRTPAAAEIAALFAGFSLSRAELARRMMDEFGIGKTAAYDRISACEGKTIFYDQTTKKYSAKV